MSRPQASTIVQTLPTDIGPFVVHRLGERGSWVLVWPARLCDHSTVQAFGAALVADHRVVLFDPPGCGANRQRAYQPAIADQSRLALQVMDAMGIERGHWVGHSVGGVIGAHLAQLAPQRVDSLTLASTPMLRSGHLQVLASALLPVLARFAWGRRQLVQQALQDLGAADAQERVRVQVHLQDMVEQVAPATLAQLAPLDGRVVRSVFEALCRQHPPLLVLAGQHDRAVLARDQRTVAELTGARFVELPCGHMSLFTQPQACARAWRAFVAAIPAQAEAPTAG